MFRSFSAHTVTFDNLATWDIAAIWRFRRPEDAPTGYSVSGSYTGCSGRVWKSRTGPGRWSWEIWDESDNLAHWTPATGASYIELPRSLPPDAKTSAWLAAEGLFGLVWGGGKWFSSPAASRILGYAPGVRPRSHLRRDIRSESKGQVYAGRPPRFVYPAIIKWNGKIYHDSGSVNQTYVDDNGITLDLTGVEV
ncbi:MAG: hypothetical protein Q9174_005027 [Haloplaca sp. 1 TL-2023]